MALTTGVIIAVVKIKQKQNVGDYYSNNPVKGIGLLNSNLHTNNNNKIVFNTTEKKGQKTKHYKVTYIGKPPLKLDKFSFTYPIIDSEYQKHIKTTMLGLYHDDKTNQVTQIQDILYRVNINLRTSNGAVIYLSCDPYASINNYFRLSFNPHKAGKYKHELKDLLSMIITGGIDLNKANITRMDIAVDYKNIKPSEIMIKASGYKVGYVFCNGAGNIETHYIGSEKSAVQYCIYDKTKEQKDKYGKNIGGQYMRVEARLRNKSIQQLEELNPFQALQIFWAPPPKSVKPHEWMFFLNYAQTVGLQAAVRAIPKQDKKPYVDRVNELVSDWWESEALLPKYKEQLQELISLFD